MLIGTAGAESSRFRSCIAINSRTQIDGGSSLLHTKTIYISHEMVYRESKHLVSLSLKQMCVSG